MISLPTIVSFLAANVVSAQYSSMSTSVIRLMHKISIVSFELTELVIALISVGAILGNVLGALLCYFIPKSFNKKYTIIIATLLNTIVFAGYMVSVHWIFTFVLRIISGMCTFVAQRITPTWLINISPSKNKL